MKKPKKKSPALGSQTHTHLQATLAMVKEANAILEKAQVEIGQRSCGNALAYLLRANGRAGEALAHSESVPVARRLAEDRSRILEFQIRRDGLIRDFKRTCFRSSALPAGDEGDDASTKRFKQLELDGPRRRKR